MAWEEVVYSATWKTNLNNGSTASGGVKTVAVNMGSVLSQNWDSTSVGKAGAILEALDSGILAKSLVNSLHTVAYSIVDNS